MHTIPQRFFNKQKLNKQKEYVKGKWNKESLEIQKPFHRQHQITKAKIK